MSSQKSIRELLIEQLNGKHAHVDFSQAVQGITWQQAGIKAEGIPHTIWQLVEHIRISQDDIIEFCLNEEYEEIAWPDDYWPEIHKPAGKDEWENSKSAVRAGVDRMKELIRNPELELRKPFPHGNGQTLFREVILIIDHGAYHIGQIVQIRRLLGSW